MPDFLLRLDQLKSEFLDNSNDATVLLHLRTQLDKPEEATTGGIETGLATALKRSMLEQQLNNSTYLTDIQKNHEQN